MSRVCWPLALAFVLLSAPIPAGGTCPNSGLKLAIAGRTAPDGQVLSFLGEHFVEVAEDGDQVCTSCQECSEMRAVITRPLRLRD